MKANSLSDADICAEQIRAIRRSIRNKRSIIRKAAQKLYESGKYSDDLTQIGQRVYLVLNQDPNTRKHVKIFHQSYIYKCLDKKYIRSYTKTDNTPNDQIEELFSRLNDYYSDQIKTAARIRETYENASEQVRAYVAAEAEKSLPVCNDYVDDVWNQLSKIKNLDDYINYVKDCQVEHNYFKKSIDRRQRLDPFMKIRIRMLLFEHSYSEIGNQFGFSSKWISKIDKDPKLDKMIETMPPCPNCNFSFTNWFKKARAAKQKGEPIPKPN